MDSFRGNNAYDRLSALRQPAPPPRQTRPRMSRFVIIGIVGMLAIVLLAAGFLFLKSNPRVEVTEVVDVENQQIPVTPTNTDTLLDGEAYIAIAADVGTFPPSLAPGDTVQVVIAPNLNSGEFAQTLPEQAVVREVRPPSEFGNTFVITIRAPQAVATAMIDAEKVHLTVVDEAAS